MNPNFWSFAADFTELHTYRDTSILPQICIPDLKKAALAKMNGTLLHAPTLSLFLR